MPLVVANAGPLHYLVLTGDIELLPKLFECVLVPQMVREELANAEAPQAVRDWIARAPGWLDVRPAHPGAEDVAVAKLDDGERAAIALALAVKAELVLMDDREGVGIARGRALAVTGTLGVLDLAARRGLIDLAAAFERRKTPTFYYRQVLLKALLAARHQARLRAIVRHADFRIGAEFLRRPAVALHRHRHAHDRRHPHRSGRGWRFASVGRSPERSRSGGRGLVQGTALRRRRERIRRK